MHVVFRICLSNLLAVLPQCILYINTTVSYRSRCKQNEPNTNVPCHDSKEYMYVHMHRNKWNGDENEYSS